jgi:hypothetical protein
MKIHPLGAKLIHVDRQAGMHAFHKYANVLQNGTRYTERIMETEGYSALKGNQ